MCVWNVVCGVHMVWGVMCVVCGVYVCMVCVCGMCEVCVHVWAGHVGVVCDMCVSHLNGSGI